MKHILFSLLKVKAFKWSLCREAQNSNSIEESESIPEFKDSETKNSEVKDTRKYSTFKVLDGNLVDFSGGGLGIF